MALFLVLEGGLEPPPEYSDCTLNAARLPVPPLELVGKIMILVCYFNLQKPLLHNFVIESRNCKKIVRTKAYFNYEAKHNNKSEVESYNNIHYPDDFCLNKSKHCYKGMLWLPHINYKALIGIVT